MGQRHYWLRQRLNYCAFLLKRHEPYGIPSPWSYSYMVCATVCLTVMPPFSGITDVWAMGHSFKTDSRRTPLLHISKYGYDIYRPRIKSLWKLPSYNWSTRFKSDGYTIIHCLCHSLILCSGVVTKTKFWKNVNAIFAHFNYVRCL